MVETVRVTREPDFFPLSAGLSLEYEHTSTEFPGVEAARILFESVDAFRDDAAAKALLTRTRGEESSSIRYLVRRSRFDVFSGGGVLGPARREFPLPPLPGKTWVCEPDRHEIASREAEIAVPAGRFRNCLRVNVFLGAGGSAIRYYAPGVGYVYEECASGDRAARVRLARYSFPGEAARR